MAFSTLLTLGLFFAATALAMVFTDPKWVRDHAWLLPMFWWLAATFLLTAITPWFRKLLASRKSTNQEAAKQEISNSTVGRDVRMAGRDYHETHIHEPAVATGRLTLLFDPADDQCVRREHGVPREYRVKVVNTTGQSAHDVHVIIERTVPLLRDHVGVRLRLRSGGKHESSVNLPNGESEYFNLLEYNPHDQSEGRPVMHICHVAETVPIRVEVDNYTFVLKARSNECISDSVTLKFEQLLNNQSQLVRA
jgi:hypothetical protein